MLEAESDHSPLCHVPRVGIPTLPFWEEVENRGVHILKPGADLLFCLHKFAPAPSASSLRLDWRPLPEDLQSLSLTRLIKSLLERNARGQQSTSPLLTLHNHTQKGFSMPLSFQFLPLSDVSSHTDSKAKPKQFFNQDQHLVNPTTQDGQPQGLLREGRPLVTPAHRPADRPRKVALPPSTRDPV